jgi:hypothetical protein
VDEQEEESLKGSRPTTGVKRSVYMVENRGKEK